MMMYRPAIVVPVLPVIRICLSTMETDLIVFPVVAFVYMFGCI